MLNKINGFSLLEGLISLSIFSLICSFLIPGLFKMVDTLQTEKQKTMLLQTIADESNLLLHDNKESNKTIGNLTIQKSKTEGVWQICAKSATFSYCSLSDQK
ncbi:type II secretion system protein [Listeria sp. PSOL-1]|uniref:type II secretion system protein n=1 Tax=Listeria sp. PSOL-1 TaxID=1844999 RepID=UPI0013D069A3|nr:type II secretion system protein [Listeria sp. PSOL-1]